MNQDETPDLFSIKGMVRANDYNTSIEAAQSVEPKRSILQQLILQAFELFGPMTDDELERLSFFKMKGYAETTVSKRRTELFQKGLLKLSNQERRSVNGRKMKVWELA